MISFEEILSGGLMGEVRVSFYNRDCGLEESASLLLLVSFDIERNAFSVKLESLLGDDPLPHGVDGAGRGVGLR